MSKEHLVTHLNEWTIFPQTVCKVTGTIYHETCIVGGGRTEYPCCDIVYVLEKPWLN